MPVEDVAVPKAGKVSEVKGQTPEKSEMDSDYWEKRAKTAVAKRDYLTTEKDIERVTNSPPAPVEQPFKITGGLNLGNIDLQAERAQTLAKLEEIRQASDAKLAALQKTADDYREQVAQIRQESGMAQLNTQIQSLQKQIADGLNSKSKSFIEQWNEINTIVETVGLKKTPVSETLTTPPTVLLELKKMDLDAARAEREFQWKMKQDDRMFAIEMKKLDQGQIINQAKVAAERDRNDLMASIPESIGKAIARGMVDGEKGYNRRAGAPGQSKLHLEAGEGEAGVTECPQCKSEIAVGPTAKSAVCPKCNLMIPVTRIPKQVKPEPPLPEHPEGSERQG